jgi:hypothetical protein
MNPEGQIPRSRGGVSGVLLILLGLWGGLAPFVGPYLNFGYTPDKAWAYTSGRLYYSIIPGAAALLGGLIVVGTRSRAAGVIGGLLAVLGGAWFALGADFMTVVLKKTSINIGGPILSGSAVFDSPQLRQYLESIALFSGLGLLILFLGALAIGRFSMLAAKDVIAYDGADSYYPPTPASQPDVSQYPVADQFQTSPDVYKSASGSFPVPGQAAAAPPFPDAPSPFQDTTTSQYPPQTS